MFNSKLNFIAYEIFTKNLGVEGKTGAKRKREEIYDHEISF